jgi:tripartite-type tricarboxylate transporter receptor subunit TctC
VPAGLKGFVQQTWVAILVPAATPKPLVERLNQAAGAAVADAGVQKRFAEMGLQAQGGAATRLGDAIRAELALNRKIAVEAKLRFE